jgi:DNA-binding response OmpR family regulator
MDTRVLLVEDDERIRQALGLALADEGCQVTDAPSGEDALRLIEGSAFDVVLLDLMLPGADGMHVCRTLRAMGDLPIIIVTARTDTSDVIAGLEAGADDYVTKPLIASELAARIRALLRRRNPGRTDGVHTFGDLVIRQHESVVTRRGVPAHLTRTEFRLLLELATADGRTVTREQLLQRVWGYDYFGDTRLLDVHIRRLRQKIEDNPDAPSLLITVRGHGYKLERSPSHSTS